MKLSYKAEIDVDTELPLVEAAKLLSNEIGFINFVEDEGERFDDVPACVSSLGDIEFVLFGPAEEDDIDGLFLQLKTHSDVDIREFIDKFGSDLFGSFPTDSSNIGSNGYIDVTKEVLTFLGANSSMHFKVAE